MAKSKRKRKTASQRRHDECGEGGCRIPAVKGRPDPNLRPPWGFNYSSGPEKCGTDRRSCPVQLTFREGQPYLRFCRTMPKRGRRKEVTSKEVSNRNRAVKAEGRSKRESRERSYPRGRRPGDPGYLLRVDSPAEAARLAAEACKCWNTSPDGFYEVIRESQGNTTKVWRGSFETCAVSSAQLGRAKGKRRKKSKRKKPPKQRSFVAVSASKRVSAGPMRDKRRRRREAAAWSDVD